MRPHLAATVTAALLAIGITAPLPANADTAPAHVDRYIVTTSTHQGPLIRVAATAATITAHGGEILRPLTGLITGYVIEADAATAQALQSDPNVATITKDQPLRLQDVQTAPSWGLDRLDGTLNGTFEYGYTGKGTYVYIVDTGIRSTHQDFTGRVAPGYDAVKDGNGTEDCQGHGTHVAGTAAGSTYGVAKEATIVPVRVMNCKGEGFSSTAIDGLNWIVAHHPKGTPGVINMSLGGDPDPLFNKAVADTVASGFVVVVAAGNSNKDACTTSPASAPLAVTVAATTDKDARADYSNYGACVDVFAPGTGIVSDYYNSDTGAATGSGTSMASPHVAGIAAQIWQAHPTWTTAEVSNEVARIADTGKITDPQGSPNLLARTPLAIDDTTTLPAAPALVKVTKTTATVQAQKPGKTEAAAAIVHVPLATGVAVIVTGTPYKKPQQVTVTVQVSGKTVTLGRATITKPGTVRLPGLQVNTAGTYLVKLLSGKTSAYITLSAP